MAVGEASQLQLDIAHFNQCLPFDPDAADGEPVLNRCSGPLAALRPSRPTTACSPMRLREIFNTLVDSEWAGRLCRPEPVGRLENGRAHQNLQLGYGVSLWELGLKSGNQVLDFLFLGEVDRWWEWFFFESAMLSRVSAITRAAYR